MCCSVASSYLEAYLIVEGGRTASLAGVCLGNEAGKAVGTAM